MFTFLDSKIKQKRLFSHHYTTLTDEAWSNDKPINRKHRIPAIPDTKQHPYNAIPRTQKLINNPIKLSLVYSNMLSR